MMRMAGAKVSGAVLRPGKERNSRSYRTSDSPQKRSQLRALSFQRQRLPEGRSVVLSAISALSYQPRAVPSISRAEHHWGKPLPYVLSP